MSTRAIDGKDGPLVFGTVRNEALRLPFFLAYHRALGCSGFRLVDNGSDDGSYELLRAQPDVVVRRTGRSFRDSGCGLRWVETMLRRYALEGQWVLLLDADELFCFPRADERSLGEFCRHLAREGATAAVGMLLDMYPDGPLEACAYAAPAPFLAASPFFDAASHRRKLLPKWAWSRLPRVYGGMRRRVFGVDPLLTKVSLLRYGKHVGLAAGYHFARGVRPSAVRCCLLHFKFLGAFGARARDEAARGEHWQDAVEYRAYRDYLERHPGASGMGFAGTRRYEGPSQLVALKIMRSSPAWERGGDGG